MADIDLAVSINRSPRVTFTAGEDRPLQIQLKDQAQDLPLDLTGARLTFALPRAGGGTVKRRTAPIAFAWATSQIENGLSVIALPSHGLVSGDIVQLAAVGPGALPAPFSADESYVVMTQTEDEFGLLDSSGNSLALAAASSAVASLTVGDFTITQPALGVSSLALAAHVTDAIAIGQGLSYQLTYQDSENLTRFVVGTNLLDVFSQPCP